MLAIRGLEATIAPAVANALFCKKFLLEMLFFIDYYV
jgi:hypothetical protein